MSVATICFSGRNKKVAMFLLKNNKQKYNKLLSRGVTKLGF